LGASLSTLFLDFRERFRFFFRVVAGVGLTVLFLLLSLTTSTEEIDLVSFETAGDSAPIAGSSVSSLMVLLLLWIRDSSSSKNSSISKSNSSSSSSSLF